MTRRDGEPVRIRFRTAPWSRRTEWRRRPGGGVLRPFVPLSLFLGLFVIYHLNGGFSVGNDCTANVYLPVSLLTEGNLSFTPHEAPFMFNWKLVTPEGESWGKFQDWNGQVRGRGRAELYEEGSRIPAVAMYYITPSVRDGYYVNTYGLGAGLAALPV